MRSRVILAYSNDVSDPVAFNAVRRALPATRELHRCVGPDGYGKLFRELWLDGRPFILVEHDNVPGPGMLNALDGCPQTFCAHGYGPTDHLPESGALIGLSAFRPMGDVPFETMRPEEDAGGGIPTYEALAGVIYRSLTARGSKVHQHTPPVTHLSPVTRPMPDGEPAAPDATQITAPVGGGRGGFSVEPPAVDLTPKPKK